MNDGHDDRPLDLSGLYADRAPPHDLEDRVTADYVGFCGVGNAAGARAPAAGSWAARARVGHRSGPLLRLAAGLALFLGGFGVARILPDDGRGVSPDSGVVDDRVETRRFMLLLWEGPGFGSDAHHSELAAEYTAWARAAAGAGIAITGAELGAERDLIPPVRPTGSAPSEEFRVGGYFVIAVSGVLAARRLAEDHPHIGHGGWIEVAEIH
jgi:hypothetical protein